MGKNAAWIWRSKYLIGNERSKHPTQSRIRKPPVQNKRSKYASQNWGKKHGQRQNGMWTHGSHQYATPRSEQQQNVAHKVVKTKNTESGRQMHDRDDSSMLWNGMAILAMTTLSNLPTTFLNILLPAVCAEYGKSVHKKEWQTAKKNKIIIEKERVEVTINNKWLHAPCKALNVFNNNMQPGIEDHNRCQAGRLVSTMAS